MMQKSRTARYLPALAWITIIWVALWGDVSWANIVGGLLVAVVVLAAIPLPRTRASGAIRLLAALKYLLRFLKDLVVATFEVARQVLWPIDRLRPGIITVPMTSHDPRLLTLIGNTITLTPGTLTLEIDAEAPALYVHVLHLVEGDEDAIIDDAQSLERLGAQVLGTDLASRDIRQEDSR